jgi:hypothetical protein
MDKAIINSISESITNNNISLNKIFTRPLKVKKGKVYISWAEGVDVEYSKIITSIKQIRIATNVISDNTIKNLPANIIALLNNTKLLLNNNFNTFTYTPYLTTTKTLPKNGNYIISKISNTVIDNMAIGSSSKKSDMIDDIINYNEESTLSISKSTQELPGVSIGLLNEINDIDDEYNISFEMRLNRFPSKTHKVKNTKYDSNNTETTKKYTSRRSDIISFNYDTENINNKIEFGAMAPFGMKVDTFNNFSLYNDNFDNFSIAACLTYDDNKKLSIYTDYKFKLGEIYNIKLSIRRITDEYMDELNREIKKGTSFIFDNIKMTNEEAKKREGSISEIMSQLNRFSQIRENYFIKFEQRKSEIDSKGSETTFKFAQKYYNYSSGEDKQAVLDILLDIKKYNDNINTFGNPAVYDIKLEVNGFLEDVSTYDGKVWGNRAKKQKKKRLLASQPGFIPATNLQMAYDRSKLNDIYSNFFNVRIDDLIIYDKSLKEMINQNTDFKLSKLLDFNQEYLPKLYSIVDLFFNMIAIDDNFENYATRLDYIQQYILNIDEQRLYPINGNLSNLIISQKKLNKMGFVTVISFSDGQKLPTKFDASIKRDVLQKISEIRFPGLYKVTFGNVTNFSMKDFISDKIIINEEYQTFITRTSNGLFGSTDLYILNNYSWSECFNKDFRRIEYISLGEVYENLGDQIIDKEFILRDDSNDKFYKLKFKSWSRNGGFSGFFQEIKLKGYEILENLNDRNKNKFGPNILYTPIYYSKNPVYIKYKDNPFLHIDKENGRYPEITKELNLNYPIYNSVTKFFKKFDITKLRSIDTVPYKINTKNQISGFKFSEVKNKQKYQSNLPQILKNIKRFDRLYGKYNYKLNSSIDFGSINIYYTKIKDQISLLNSEIQIDGTKDSTNVIQIESISSEIKGSKLNPIVELSIYPELPPGLTLSNTGNIEGNTSFNTNNDYTISAVIYNKEYITNKKYKVNISTNRTSDF